MRRFMILLLVAGTLFFAAGIQADDQNVAEADCVTFVKCPQGIGTSHCTPVSFQFEAVNARNEKPNHGVRYHLASGPGQIDERTGLWTFDPKTVDITQWGQRFRVMVVATQGRGKHADTCRFSVRVYNYAPRPFLPGPYHKDSIPVVAGADNVIPVWWVDRDSCDTVQRQVTAIPPQPSGELHLSNEGNLVFHPAISDTGLGFVVKLTADDGISSNSLDVRLFVEPPVVRTSEYTLRIEKVHYVLQGLFQEVSVLMERASSDTLTGGLGGYDLLLGYDASALALQLVKTEYSPFYNQCNWEYFTYRYGAVDSIPMGYPSGYVRVVGLAETNNGPTHPTCTPKYVPELPATLFTMKFLISNDRALECTSAPIRFYWRDCDDNTLSSWHGEQLHVVNQVFEFEGFNMSDTGVLIDPISATLPGTSGLPDDSCVTDEPGRPLPSRDVDFYHGGLDIVCADSIDPRGDINLNGTAFEVSDCVMFRNYFIFGPSAFQGHVQGSTQASDINADGIPLTLADYVTLARVVCGAVFPAPLPIPEPVTINLIHVEGNGCILSASDTLGALLLVVQGEITPELLVLDADMHYASENGVTRILIDFRCVPTANIGPGPIVKLPDDGSANCNLVQVEASSNWGVVMPVMLDDLHMVALRGDINGNSIPFETEDYTSYFNYFFFDTSAFQGHVAQSIENSDVNLDGKTLTVADLLYLWRVIEGDSLPYPEPVDSDVHATFYQPGGTIGQLTGEFPDSLGAVYFVLDGSSSNLCFYEYECHWYYDGTNTRVLLAPTIPGEPVTAILPGWIIGYGTMWDVHHIIRAEAATYDGAVMPAELGTWLDVPEDNTSLPRTFALHQNYPNPFNAGTVISFDLPRAADVRLEVLNIAGQVVYEVNRHYAAGSHEIEWDGTVSGRSVASGVYYYRISAGEFTATKKMVLLK